MPLTDRFDTGVSILKKVSFYGSLISIMFIVTTCACSFILLYWKQKLEMALAIIYVLEPFFLKSSLNIADQSKLEGITDIPKRRKIFQRINKGQNSETYNLRYF